MTWLLLFSFAFAAPEWNAPGQITLPWNDFQALYRKYVQEEPKPPAAPRDWTLSRAVYAGRVVGEGEEGYAMVTLSLSGQVHKKEGWTTIPLVSSSAALKSARIGGKEAPVFVQDGFYQLVMDKPGAFDLQLEMAVRLFSGDGVTGFSLPLAQSGATVVAVAVPARESLQFEVPGSQGVNSSKVGDEYRVEAFVQSLPSVTVSWQRELQEDVAKVARVYAEVQTLVGVSEGLMQASSTVGYTVLHAGVDHFSVTMPKDVTVLDVRGAGIREWTQKGEVIEVALNYAALGGYSLSVDYEKALSAQNELPLLKVRDVVRETDWIGIDARSAVELVPGEATGAVPVDVRELPASIVGRTDFPVLLGYKARGGEVRVPLEVKTHASVDMLVTLADLGRAETLVTEDGRRMTRVTWGVRNNRKQFLRVVLPEGAEVWSATVAGRAVKIAKDEKGVLVPLVRSDASGGALAAFGVELVYVEAGEALSLGRGWAKMALPRIDAPMSLLQWSVYVPERMKVKQDEGDGSIRRVRWFSSAPSLPSDATVNRQAAQELDREVYQQSVSPGSMGQGVEPVDVQLPLTGTPLYFEKMLVLGEELWVGFDYRLKKR